jgi:hypothetical protein
MRATPATRRGPVARDPRRPPGRARPHKYWTGRGGLVTGGTVYSASGDISQNDFASLVNSGLMKGDVNIITGAHGAADGSTVVDRSLYDADVSRFGGLPGVKVYNLPDLSRGQVTELINGPGTTIAGFCNSGACLAPYK